jgi:hypothetical protein
MTVLVMVMVVSMVVWLGHGDEVSAGAAVLDREVVHSSLRATRSASQPWATGAPYWMASAAAVAVVCQ